MKASIFCILLILFPVFLWAQADNAVVEPELKPQVPPQKLAPPVKPKVTSKELRHNNNQNLFATLSLLETWVPNKWGVSYSYNQSSESSWELEYTSGAIKFSALDIDIGKISERRISMLKRSYAKRNSFHFFYGLHYYELDIYLGDSLVDSVTGNGRYDLIKVSNIGLTWGTGNRWYFTDNFVFGVDWFAIYIPLFAKKYSAPYLDQTSDPNDRKNVEDALDIIEDIPTVSSFRLHLGYSF